VIGIVVLDVHLATQRMPHRRLNLLRKLEHLFAGVLHTCATEKRDGFSLVNCVGKRGGLAGVREYNWATAADSGSDELVIFHLMRCNVARQNQHGNTVASHGRLDSVMQNDATLLSGVDHLAVTGALV